MLQANTNHFLLNSHCHFAQVLLSYFWWQSHTLTTRWVSDRKHPPQGSGLHQQCFSLFCSETQWDLMPQEMRPWDMGCLWSHGRESMCYGWDVWELPGWKRAQPLSAEQFTLLPDTPHTADTHIRRQSSFVRYSRGGSLWLTANICKGVSQV